ncbi:MAG: acyl-CoA synthetase (AMP-forming)/AMP-acid ligase, partial [Mycobacterium sp.]|nr:acyl-CoA synthetase (AMP-forming)/AMP-acid ligase [Mycobacterium sp.]
MRGDPPLVPKYATLTEMLAAAAHSGERLVFVDRREEDHEVPMAQVRQQALSIAADLVGRGVRRGDRVAIVL